MARPARPIRLRPGTPPAVALAVLAAVGAAAREAQRGWGLPLLGLATIVLMADAVTRRDGGLPTIARVSAWISPFAAVPAARLVARQYVERLVPGGRYQGPLFPVALWTGLLAASLAVVATVGVLAPLCLAFRRRQRLFSVPGLVAALTAGGFLWRVYALLRIAPARTDGGDPLYYHTQANTLARGLGFIEPLNWIASGTKIATAVHGPGYTIYLGLFSRLGASTWFDHRMASTVLGAVVVLLAASIARRIAGDVAGVLAGLLAVFYPNLWTIDIVLFPEGLFIVCCGLSVLLAYRWYDHRRHVDAVLLGAAIGAAALTRGEGVFLMVLLVAPLVLLRRDLPWRRRIATYGLAVAGCLVLMAPWMLRNLARFEDFVPLSTNGNELHVYSNCADTYSGKFLGFWLFDCQQRLRDPNGDGVVDFEPPGDESQKASYWQSVGFQYAKDHVSQLPKVALARVGRQWDLFRPLQNAEFAPIEGRDPDWARAGLAYYYGLVLAAVPGVRRLRRMRVPLLPLGSQFLAVTITALYAYGTTRFRAPAELALCILAGVGLAPYGRRLWRLAIRPLDRSAGRSPAVVLGAGGSSPVVEPVGTPAAPPRDDVAEADPADRAAPPTGVSRWWTFARRHWYLAVPALAIAAIVRGQFLAPGAPMEEGFMLVFPERLLKGDVPNVDFLHLYGPGSLHVLAAVYKVFGATVTVERTYGLVVDTAIVLALVVLARPWGRVAAALAGVMGVLVVFTPIGLSALAWHGAVALGLWSVIAALRGGRHGAWVAALLAALALTFRPDLVVTLVAVHGARWWLDGRHRPSWREARIPVAAFVVGFLPMLVHLAIAGPSAVWRGVVVEPVFTLRGGRTLPRPPSWDHLDGALQVIGEKPPPWWPFPHTAPSHQLFLWFFLLPLLSIGGLVLAIRWWRRGHDPRVRVLVVVGAFGTGLLTQALQRPDSTHLLWGSVVTFPLAVCFVAEAWSRRSGRGTALGRVAVLLAPLVFVFAVLPSFTFRTYTMHLRQTLGASHHGLGPGLPVRHGDREFRLGDVRAWLAGQALVDDLARMSKPGERMLVGPVDLRQTAYSDAFFYHLFPELTPATKYIEMDPGLANAPGSGLTEEVLSADWLVLTRYWAGWIEPNDSIVFGPDDPNVAVEEHFCLVGSYEHDLTRLYHRCEGGGAPGPYEGPYDPAYDYAVEVKVPVPPRSDGTHPPGSPAAP